MNIDPSQLDQASQQIGSMSDEQLRMYAQMSGMNVDPAMLRMMSQQMKNMSPQQKAQMTNMAKNMSPADIEKQKKMFNSGALNQNYSQTTQPIPQVNQQIPKSNSNFPEITQLREKGNASFKLSNYSDAAEKYLSSILEIEELKAKSSYDNMAANLKEELKQLEIQSRLNYSVVKAKQNDFDAVRNHSSKVLALDPENAKGNFRLGQALFHLKRYKQAQDNLLKASKGLPNDSQVKEYLQNTIKEIEAQQNKSQEVKVEKIQEVEKEPAIIQKEIKKEKETVLIEEEEVQQKPVSQAVNSSFQQQPGMNVTGVPQINEDVKKQAQQQIKNMSDDDLKNMTNQFKSMDRGFLKQMFKQQQGIEMDDQQLDMMMNMMSPELLKTVSSMDPATIPNNPTGIQNQQNLNPMDPSKMDFSKIASDPNMANVMNNPDMIKTAMEQMKKNPEMLKSMAKMMGPNNPMASMLENSSPEQIEKMLNMVTKFQPLINVGMKGFTLFKKYKYFILSALALVFAYYVI